MSIETWAAVGAVGAGSVLGFLYAIACMVRNEHQMRELTARIVQLREERLTRAREIAESQATVVDVELEGVNVPAPAEIKAGKK